MRSRFRESVIILLLSILSHSKPVQNTKNDLFKAAGRVVFNKEL